MGEVYMRIIHAGVAISDRQYAVKLTETLTRTGGDIRFRVIDGTEKAYRSAGPLDIILTDVPRSYWSNEPELAESGFRILLTREPEPGAEDEIFYYEDADLMAERIRFLLSEKSGLSLDFSEAHTGIRISAFTSGSLDTISTALSLAVSAVLGERNTDILYVNLRSLDSSRIFVNREGGADLMRFLYRLRKGDPIPLDRLIVSEGGINLLTGNSVRNPLSESFSDEMLDRFLEQIGTTGKYGHLILDIGPEINSLHFPILERSDHVVHARSDDFSGFDKESADLVRKFAGDRCVFYVGGSGWKSGRNLSVPVSLFKRETIEELADRLE